MKRYTIDGDSTPSGYTFFVVAGRRRIASARTYQEAEKLAPAALRRFERYQRRRSVMARRLDTNGARYRCAVCGRAARRASDETVCGVCRDTPAGKRYSFDQYCKRYGLSPRYDAAL